MQLWDKVNQTLSQIKDKLPARPQTLPGLPLGAKFPQKEVPHQFYLALIFKEQEITAVVWEEKQGVVDVVDNGTVQTTQTIDSLTDEQLIMYCDQAIGIAEKTLPENVKTTKTIFGVNEWWVQNNTISDAYLPKIKKLCKELDLKPVGFVVLAEAVVHLLQKQEEGLPTILLILLGKESQTVTLVRSGKIEMSRTEKKNGRTDTETTLALIRSFGHLDMLPSRLLLFDGTMNLGEIQQDYISFAWTKHLPFLHFPRIDILSADGLEKAVVGGAAKEMGFAFEETTEIIEEPVAEVAAQTDTVEEKEAETEEKPEEQLIAQDSEVEEESAFGFVQDEESSVVEVPSQPEPAVEEPKTAVMPEEEVPKQASPAPATHPAHHPHPKQSHSSFSLSSFHLSLSDMGIPPSVAAWIGNTKFLLIAAGGLLLIIIAMVVGFYLQKATVTLALQTKTLENDITLTADPNATGADVDKKIIPAHLIETKLDGKKEAPVTGKKTIGDPAHGTITIYNKTENKKTFPKGTILVGSNNLQFTLDDDVSIASTDAFATTPTTTTGKVTAVQIGPDSNLGAGTNFPFKDFPTSSYFAKNDQAFAGGSKKDVTVVSKDDQSNLEAAVLDDLKNQAKDDLSNKSQGMQLVSDAINADVSNETFSKKIGDEASTLSVALTGNFSTVGLNNSDMFDLLNSMLGKDIPQDYSLRPEKIQTQVKEITKDKSGMYTITLHYSAALSPKLDENDIKKNITGKSTAAVEGYLHAFPVDTVSISQNYSIPLFSLLPVRTENITIVFQ